MSLLVLSAWSSWEASHMPPPVATDDAAVAPPGSREESAAGEKWPGDEGREITSQSDRPETAGGRIAAPRTQAGVERALVEPWQGALETDLYRVALDNRGGGIVSWHLLDPKYTASSKKGDSSPLDLVTRLDESTVVLTTALEGLGIGNLKDELFRVEGGGSERVVFSVERSGITVRKIFEFNPEDYTFDVTIEIANATDRSLETDIDLDWPAAMVDGNDFREQALIALVNDEVEQEPVASVGSGGFFSFLGNGDEGPTTLNGLVEWAGVSNRYFLAALMPNPSTASVAQVSFEPVLPGKTALTRFVYEDVEVKPGQIVERNFRAYMGPKLPEVLAEVKPGLERSIDFGYSWLEPLTRFFHGLLAFLYGVFPNYGVAIILVTLMVRLATLPIMQKQMKSMERMRELQPRLKEIQEEFKEDRQKQSEAQMKLYKEEGVNPLGGCLPMLLQFPVFIGLFYALQSTIALRHAPFVFWITDLSAPEELFEIPGLGIPIRVLPIVMGASMFIQQRMTPMTGMDPVQARMMTTVMPLMMLVLFYQFPSGLVLYWMISNFLGIGHQLWVRRRREAEAKAAA
ncbi:MAG: membrane protein insertase YidC [Deltaproteobacteria bacterium]|nr:membrane protein insertase YidC [Deltaproteobacteria bacterium]